MTAQALPRAGIWRYLRFDLLIAIVTLTVLAGIAVSAARFIAWEQDRSIHDGNADAGNLALLAQQHWKVTLSQIEALHAIARLVTLAHLAGDTVAEAAARRELELAVPDPRIEHVAATDGEGRLLWSTVPDVPEGFDLSFHEHFRALKSGEYTEFVGRSVVGRITGLRQIRFAKAMRAPDGGLAAMTVISLSPDVVKQYAVAINLAPTDIIDILRDDGVVLGRSDGLDLTREQALKLLAVTKTAIGGPPLVNPSDGIPRFIGSASLGLNGLVVHVGLDAQRQLAAVDADTQLACRGALLLGLMVTGLAISLVLILRGREYASRARLRAEAIRLGAARFRQLVENVREMVCLYDRSGRVTYASPGTRELLGIDPVEIEGGLPGRFLHPDDADKDQARFASLLATGSTSRAEFRMMRPDGLVIWVEMESQLIRDGLPAENGARGVMSMRDITRRHMAEENLRAAKQDIETLLAAGPAVIYRLVADETGHWRLRFISDNMSDVIGSTEHAAWDTGIFHRLVDPAAIPRIRATLEHAASSGEGVVEYRFRDHAGNWLWIRDRMRRFTRPDGGVELVGHWMDVTQEHAIAEQLAQTAKLAVLGEMAAGMAHELNQPLASISMAAENAIEMLVGGWAGDSKVVIGKLERIIAQAQRAGLVIEHMGIFGRQGTGEPVPIRIADAIEGATSIMQAKLARQRVDVRTDVTTALPKVMGHLVLLEQVFVNLLSNACDAYAARGEAGDPGPREIRLAAGIDGEFIHVAIADRAGGVPEDIISKLFEPFFTTKPIGEGTGLGLSISYGIIADMGGTLTVRNEAGGALFEIRLPVAAAQGRDMVPSGASEAWLSGC
jgi:PAS domain S-box-containing protein